MSTRNDGDAEERRVLLDDDAAAEASAESSPSASSHALGTRVKQALHDPSKLNGLEKLFGLLVVVLLLLTATFAGLFAGEKVALDRQRHRSSPLPPSRTVTASPLPTTSSAALPGPTKKPSKNDQVCTTPTCVQVAAEVISGMDLTIDPCDDFYLFANGNWLKTHPIPDGAGLYGAAQDIGVRNTRIILDIISSASQPTSEISPSDADKTNLAHLRTFWDSCLDEDRIDRQGLEPLLAVIEQVVKAWRGSDHLVDSMAVQQQQQAFFASSKKWDPETKRDRLTSTLSYLHSRAIPSLFEFYPGEDSGRDPKTLVAWVQQADLGLPSKEYYKDDEVTEVYREIIRATLKSVYPARKEKKADFAGLAKAVLKFESLVAKITGEGAEGDPVQTYNPRNSTELGELFPLVSFPDYFASFTPRPHYPDPVVVTDPAYLRKLSKIVEAAEPDVLEAYFIFRTSQALGPLLGPKQTVRKEIDWLNNFLGGIAEGTKKPRRDICVQSMLDNFGFMIGRPYVQQAFAGDSKAYAEEIIVATIQAFKDRLPELTWLDNHTRKLAEEKASAITHKIGYPTVPDTEDPASLERWYSLNMPIKVDDYLGNVLRSRIADQKRNWAQVGRPQDKGRWEMIPSEVNAYYSPPANEIAFPAGILQSPYFSRDWPEFLAFGAFGSVAGHELSHAFDQAGRKYDKNGKLENWWTNETTRRFEHLQKCIIDQYANYSVTDSKGRHFYVQSKITNGEDMADLGGIQQSFKAWKDRFDSDRDGQNFDNYLLPGLSNFTREQLFFVAYARGWTRNISPAEAVKRIRTDPHSPTNYRVIGPLSNSQEFADAFKCKAGSRMSNKHKCHVW
ncbi:hypothetical protein OIV83_002926 [Microbotryomycetes sp. JL201]|nr:hypothetical protein OIV83_002926 [Microbotryomycetes sp. JL201]